MQAPPFDPARYQIRNVLGRGGMSTVHLAYDAVLGRPVALKVLAEHLAEDGAFRARIPFPVAVRDSGSFQRVGQSAEEADSSFLLGNLRRKRLHG